MDGQNFAIGGCHQKTFYALIPSIHSCENAQALLLRKFWISEVYNTVHRLNSKTCPYLHFVTVISWDWMDPCLVFLWYSATYSTWLLPVTTCCPFPCKVQQNTWGCHQTFGCCSATLSLESLVLWRFSNGVPWTHWSQRRNSLGLGSHYLNPQSLPPHPPLFSRKQKLFFVYPG